jgi:hypothetical protein
MKEENRERERVRKKREREESWRRGRRRLRT